MATNTNANNGNLRLHPRYALEYWKLRALFEGDPDFVIGELDDVHKSCELTVRTQAKADLFNSMSRFEDLKVTVKAGDMPVSEEALAELFSTNPHFSRLYEAEPEEAEGTFFKAVLFKPECMHYYSDDFFSPTGHSAILPQDLARDLFGEAINIQTDLHE